SSLSQRFGWRIGQLALGQVIVFDEHRIKQPGPMVMTAAAPYCVLFQPTPTGRCLTRVVDTRAGSGDCVDKAARLRGHTRQPAYKVQKRTLPRKQIAGRAGKLTQAYAAG